MNISIIGLGLIGGSIAIDLKKRNFAKNIIGFDSNKLHLQTALNLELIDKQASSIDDAINKVDLIILAIPVNSALELLPKILDKIEDNQTVTDACSTKDLLVKSVKYHPNRKCYVAAHPMAGTEFSGPWAAKSNLFDSKACILCNVFESNLKSRYLVKDMFEALNMRIILMDAQHHDAHAAYVSHISHISSFALARTVIDKERNEKNIFDLASGGFDSTVRLAKSSASMWTPIFIQNRENILTVMDTYIEKLKEFRESISSLDERSIEEMIMEANKVSKVLA